MTRSMFHALLAAALLAVAGTLQAASLSNQVKAVKKAQQDQEAELTLIKLRLERLEQLTVQPPKGTPRGRGRRPGEFEITYP